jgi:hypothetical protein
VRPIAVSSAANLLPPAADNGLLPPAAGGGEMAATPVPLPNVDEILPPQSLAVAEPEANFVSTREPPKKVIKVGREEIILKRLTPEEKAARRLKNNIVLFFLCMSVFGLIVWLAIR